MSSALVTLHRLVLHMLGLDSRATRDAVFPATGGLEPPPHKVVAECRRSTPSSIWAYQLELKRRLARICRCAMLRGSFGLVTAGLMAACTTAPTTDEIVKVQVEILDAARKFETLYLVQPGDQLEVFLYKHPDFSRKVVVRSDGYISLPLLDEVKVAGKAPRDVATELRTLFATRLKDPDVNVMVMNPPEPMVYVVGQVGIPRSLPLRQASTLAQALAQAGDAAKSGAINSISVIRLNAEGQLQSHRLDTHGKDVSQPEVYMAMAAMPLKANDLIVIPESYRSQIVRALQDTGTILGPIFNVLILREVYR